MIIKPQESKDFNFENIIQSTADTNKKKITQLKNLTSPIAKPQAPSLSSIISPQSFLQTHQISRNSIFSKSKKPENFLQTRNNLESVYESPMLYEKDFFEYKFTSPGLYTLKAMNLPHAWLNIEVKEAEPISLHSLSSSQLDMSLLSSQSISQFLGRSSLLMRADPKMAKVVLGTGKVIFSRAVVEKRDEICDYFGVKSSLIGKYEILNRIFSGKARGKDPEVSPNQSLKQNNLKNGPGGFFDGIELNKKENVFIEQKNCLKKKNNQNSFEKKLFDKKKFLESLKPKSKPANQTESPKKKLAFPEREKHGEIIPAERYLEYFRSRFE